MEIFVVLIFKGQKTEVEVFKDKLKAQDFFEMKSKSYTCEFQIKKLNG